MSATKCKRYDPGKPLKFKLDKFTSSAVGPTSLSQEQPHACQNVQAL
jgi:hypothetical protein